MSEMDLEILGPLDEARKYLSLGDFTMAQRSLQSADQINSKTDDYLKEMENCKAVIKADGDCHKSYGKKDYRAALFYANKALTTADKCNRLKLMKAECLALLKRYAESQDILTKLYQEDPKNPDIFYIKGMMLYYQDNVDKAFSSFAEALRLCPDHAKAQLAFKRAKLLKSKKEEGNIAYKATKLDEAHKIYTDCLTIDPLNTVTNAKLYFNRALVWAKKGKLQEAIADCTNAIKNDEHYIKAYLKRAKLYLDSEMYEEAVREYDLVYKKDKTKEHKKLLEEAKLALKKSKRKDYYKILGVKRDASQDDIKKAYRKRALIHHPDRHSNASEDVKRDQETQFKALGEAYNILSDPKKRARYDLGYDEDGSSYSEVSPNDIFRSFFDIPTYHGNTYSTGSNSNFQYPNYNFNFANSNTSYS
ncbi:dnaJ homolog subfamily C member 7-like [Panonychus citri]|uniref:dnaJ homolog subfamily C member 7-like n=1 Tax=Panonychus citri TaxID=50023 RepID=UPI002307A4D0|nr:dnaJ homolog subfamily C member 7-like [Panonychus citri]